MHVNTFSSFNAVTDVYVRELERLRSALLNQLAQIDSQILICRDFADPAVELPLEPVPPADLPLAPEPTVTVGMPAPEGDGYTKPLFCKNWESELRKPDGVVPVNSEGRPVLKQEDLKRLEAAIAGG